MANRRNDSEPQSAKSDADQKKQNQASPQLAGTHRVKTPMEILIYWAGALCGIATILAALFGTLGHRDLAIWTSCAAVIFAVLGGFCWLQNYHWNKDATAAVQQTTPKLGERPYMVLNTPKCDLDKMRDSEDARFMDVLFENTGNVPAVDAIIVTQSFLTAEELTEPPTPVVFDESKASRTFVAPHTKVSQTMNFKTVIRSAEAVEAIKNRTRFFYIRGFAKYVDSGANVTHTTNFFGCYNPETKNFDAVPFGNETD